MRRLIFPPSSRPPSSCLTSFRLTSSRLTSAALCVLLLLPLLAAPARASDLAPVDAHDAAVVPGDPAWPLARQAAGPLSFMISLDPQAAPPAAFSDVGPAAARNAGQAAAGAFRIDFDLSARTGACACIGTSERRSHYRSRGIEFAVRASRPLAAILYITTSSPDDRTARDRFFGTFDVGAGWKVLRVSFRSLAALPSWPEEARRQGLVPGDLVLRPDSMEDIRIGVDGRRTEPGAGTLWVGGIRFFR